MEIHFRILDRLIKVYESNGNPSSNTGSTNKPTNRNPSSNTGSTNKPTNRMEIHSRILEFRLEKMLTTEANTLLSVSRLENKTEEERQTGKQIDALCRVETVACLHVSVVRTQANARACVRELVTREAQRSPRTYVRTYVCTYVAAGSVPIMGMQVAKQVPFIHVRRALVAYHLQFPIYHLPSSSAGRVSTSASLSLSPSFSLFLRGLEEKKREREREGS